MFESVAVFVTTKFANPTMVRFDWVGNTGGTFTSLTTTVKLFVAFKAELSVTIVVITFVLGPCPSAGVQVMMPLALLICAFAGGFCRTYVKGRLEPVAVLVTVIVANSLIVRLAWAGRTGGFVLDRQHRHALLPIATVSMRQPLLPLPLSVPQRQRNCTV